MILSNKQITVIIANYNATWERLRRTVVSTLLQEKVDLEVIIADDSSDIFYRAKIVDLFKSYGFKEYTIIENKVNVGTVKNLCNAIVKAKGMFTYTISSGDMFYDKSTLFNMLCFAISNKADVCFGDYVRYSVDKHNNVSLVSERFSSPQWPQFFEVDALVNKSLEALLFGNYILGATFLRKTDIFRHYLGLIDGVSMYVEDNTTTAFMLADGIRVYHFKKCVVWYEQGSGISTQKNEKWIEILDSDFNNSLLFLHRMHKEMVYIEYIIEFCKINKSFKKILYIIANFRRFGIYKIKYALYRKKRNIMHPEFRNILGIINE